MEALSPSHVGMQPWYVGHSTWPSIPWPTRPIDKPRPSIIGIYGREERRLRLERFHEKRKRRLWNREGNVYKCRKEFAKTRKRVNGRFKSSKDDDGCRSSESKNFDDSFAPLQEPPEDVITEPLN